MAPMSHRRGSRGGDDGGAPRVVGEVVAHRGAWGAAPENTLAAFEQAVRLGADAVEFDVRLTSDGVPVVYHYAYFDGGTTLSGPVFARSFADVRLARVRTSDGSPGDHPIPSFEEVLAALAGRIGLEVHLHGPEPEGAALVADMLRDLGQRTVGSVEVTSYDPLLLAEVRRRYPGVATDLLFPRSPEWMGLDYCAHAAAHGVRLAGARAVHLHPSQLSEAVVERVRAFGAEVHAWDVC